MQEGYRNRLITLPDAIWARLDAETKAEKRNGCSKQLEVILESRYGKESASAASGNGKKARKDAYA